MAPFPKIRSLAASAGVCMVLLSACASQTSSATPTPDLTTTVQPTSAPLASATPTPPTHAALDLDPTLLKGVKLTFIHPWSGDTGQTIERITAEFNEQNIWGFRVNLVAAGSAGEEFDLVMQAIEEGELPQIAAAYPDHAAAWVKEEPDVIVDLSPFIQDEEWGMKAAEIEDFYPSIWNQTIREGNQTGIPAERALQILVYNQSWARELGFSEAPALPEEFQEQVCDATHANLLEKKQEKIGTGGYILSNDPNTQLSWLASFGFDPASLNDDQGYRFQGPAAEASFTYLRQLFDKDCMWPTKEVKPFDYFAQRQSLVYAAGTADLPKQEMALTLAENTDEWTVIPFPGESGQSALQTGLNYVILDSNPPEELAAWIFLRWLMLPRNQADMVEAGSSLPLSQSAMAELSGYGDKHPQWLAAVSLMENSVPAPAQSQWRNVKNVLEDAAWQLIQPTLQPIPEILYQLDETVPEVIK